MGAVAFILVMLGMLACGVYFCIGGGITLALSMRRREGGARVSKTVAVIAGCFLLLGIGITLLPVGYFGWIFWINATLPDDYVQTEITIEEDGYQAERFTADGVLYVALDEIGHYEALRTCSEPIFSYQTKGLWNGSQCGNYYLVEDGQPHTLIWDGNDRIFCPASERETVMAYYNAMPSVWYEYETGVRLPQEAQDILRDHVWELDEDAPVYSLDEQAQMISLEALSEDGLLWREAYEVLLWEGEAYLVVTATYDPDERAEYSAVKLDQAVAQALSSEIIE